MIKSPPCLKCSNGETEFLKVYKNNNYTNCLYLYSGYCISHVFSVKGTVPIKKTISSREGSLIN